MRRIHLFIVLTIALVVGGAWFAYHKVDASVRNSYAVWWVAAMVIEHMQAHDGDWPKDWSDLNDDYELCVRRSGRPWTFEELRGRVIVDWQADTKQLTDQARRGQPFRVIWLADGTDSHYQSHEPNKMLSAYFLEKPPQQKN